MAQNQVNVETALNTIAADARPGAVSSGSWTVNTTASITIPAIAVGFRIYPTTNSIRFAVNDAPIAAGSSALTLGGIAKNDQWETRILSLTATNSTLQLLSGSSTVVEVEFF